MCGIVNWFNVGEEGKIYTSNASKIFNSSYSITLLLRSYPKAKRIDKDIKATIVTKWYLGQQERRM